MSNRKIYIPSIIIKNYMLELVSSNHPIIFNTKKEAIKYGKEYFKEFIENSLNVNFKNFPYEYQYDFIIFEYDLNHIKFNNDKELIDYYNKNIQSCTKENLYDFCTSLAYDVWSVYDYKGNYISNIIYTEYAFEYDCCFDELDVSRKSVKFKVGDIVRKKGSNELYKVINVPDCILLESNNILGYNGNIFITLLSIPKEKYDIDNVEAYLPSNLKLYNDEYLDYSNISEKDIETLIINNKFIDWINIFNSISLSFHFLDKYYYKIDWILFSAYHKINDEILDRYHDKIDWDIIQARYEDISLDIINKYPDKINWRFILKNKEIPDEIFIKNKDYIIKSLKGE